MFRFYIVIVLILLMISAAQAQTIDPYVNDFAGVLLEPFEDNLRAQFESFADSQDIQLTLATLIERQDAPEQLFEEWQIGQGFSAGILILIYTTEQESAVVSTLEAGVEQEITTMIDATLDAVTVSSLYSLQIYSGVSEVVDLLSQGVSLDQNDDDDVYADILKWRALDGAFSLGDPNAPITIVLFTDFACPHCQEFRENITRPLIDEYVREGQAIFEYRTMITAGGDRTDHAARLMECADEQRNGTAWEAFDLFFIWGATRDYSTDMTADFADELDLDVDRLVRCLPTAIQIRVDSNYASTLGVMGTPEVYARYPDGTIIFLDRNWQTISNIIEEANP